MSTTIGTEAGAPALVLDPVDSAALGTLAEQLCGLSTDRIDDPDWVAAARNALHDTPAAFRRSLSNFRRDSGSSGSMLLGGLPVDPDTVPETPTVPGSVQRTATVPAALLMLTACALGDPGAFLAEKSGALVQDVVPVPAQEEFQGNAGSVELSFHNENAFHPHRPEYIMLLCLREDHERRAGLRTVCTREILPLLDDTTRACLSSPEFETAPPPSFGAGTASAPPHAVLFGDPSDPDLRVDLAATKPLTTRAADALGELQRLFAATARTAYLMPGDLAIVDNRVTVHGRTAFTPRYDGRDRYVQRTFVMTDLRRSRAYRPGDGYVLEN
ncbi:TauD/TfdA family dioxygenase [Streptomyces sp. NBC_00057]|uniref:TauD/TfdA family dioxygenase n=1 Tax=Streptomyces sp. NBC_00057 TaxID=2975634 RepID=UPI0032485625